MNMDFDNMLKELSSQLRGMARRLNGHPGFVDENDLLQEMRLHLWRKWEGGETEDKTESYLLQSCWFHVRNYIRTVNGRSDLLSLDAPTGDEQSLLGEMVPDNSGSVWERVNCRTIIESIRQDGLTSREKEVFDLSLEGNTLREIGKQLGISFVRISKIKANISKKCRHLAN